MKNLAEDDYPLSVAFKAELSLVGEVSLLLGSMGKKMMAQCSYLGDMIESYVSLKQKEEDGVPSRLLTGESISIGGEYVLIVGDVMGGDHVAKGGKG